MSVASRNKTVSPKILLFVMASGVLVCLSPRASAQSVPSIKPDPSAAKLQTDTPALMKEADIPGMTIVLIRNGQIAWHNNFGVKNTKTAQPVDDNTIFEAASLSKPVFAYAVLKLVEQGKVGLDVPLTTYLPKSYIENDARLEKITARFVLSHRTGFPNWRGDGNPLTIHFTPGERFSYSGEGFVYLQRVVEQIEGKPLNEVMNALVFAPLGMTSSSYVWRVDFDERTATGHDSDGTPQDLWRPKEAGAASTLNTTAHDYALFVAAIVNGVGLKRATFREMETPQIAVNPECTNCTEKTPKELSKNIFWGLGWGIQKNGNEVSLWHWGDNGSFKCFVVANPARKSGVMMFTNSENGLAIAPAVLRDATGADHLAFGWIKYDAYDSAAMKFRKAIREQGLEAALQLFATQLRDGTISEGAVNSLGYHLLWQKHNGDAIRIFRLNTELHPQSANSFDSLGEGYMESGDKRQAIENYERSLALDPKNSNAVAQLKKLRGTSH
jgi:CubicO group peptidase (beta-lactamase class C family)